MEGSEGCQDCEEKENDWFIGFLKNWQQRSTGEPMLWFKINTAYEAFLPISYI